MIVKMVKLSEVKNHPLNPRIHPESAIMKLEQSIQEFGWTSPVLVSADGFVLAGHARLKAAERLGLKEVPVIQLDISGSKADAYLIADNRLHEETDWDRELLAKLVDDLKSADFNIDLTGFTGKDLDRILSDSFLGKGQDIKNEELDTADFSEEHFTHKCPRCGFSFDD